MQYFGGKHRIAKVIGAYLNQFPHTSYLEPFVGSGVVLSTQRERERGVWQLISIHH